MIAPLVILAVLAAPSVTKLPASGDGTVTISAERVNYNLRKHRIDYTGNPVRLTRGDEILTCKRLGAQLDDAEQVQVATCEGDVRFVRADKVVTCAKATYDETASRLTCEGSPTLKSGAMSASGSRLVYDLASDEVTMDDVHGDVPANQADQRLQSFQARRKAKPREGQK